MRIGIIAPSLALRTGLRALLADFDALGIVHEAASLAGFAEVSVGIDVVLITAESLSIPVLRQVLPEEEGRLGVLLISDQPEDAQGLPGLPLRAWGVLPLDASGAELYAALLAIGQGLLVGPAALLEAAIGFLPLVKTPAGLERRLSRGQDTVVTPLTERESQVLQYVARGLANKQIAMALNISEHTVKFHISSIYAKLGVASRTEAVRAGVQLGLVLL